MLRAVRKEVIELSESYGVSAGFPEEMTDGRRKGADVSRYNGKKYLDTKDKNPFLMKFIRMRGKEYRKDKKHQNRRKEQENDKIQFRRNLMDTLGCIMELFKECVH